MTRHLTITLALFVFSITFAHADSTPRILNGTAGFTSSYSWIANVSVETTDGSGSGSCGGALISSSWILTAAHCFLNDDGDAVDTTAASRTTIILNSDDVYNQYPDVISQDAKQVVVHPSYNPDYATSDNANDYDIALVELPSPVSLAPVSLMSASSPAVADGTQTIVMGWGSTAVDAANQAINPSDTLLQAQQKIVSQSECESVYGDDITANMICAGALTAGSTTDTCTGDSGGPMVVPTPSGFVQVGIVSFGGTSGGPVCGDPDAPGVYARVSALNSFISQYVTDATFQSVSPLTATCAGTSVDSALNLNTPCFSAAGNAFSGVFTMIDKTNLLWQWNGLLGSSACGYTDAECATLDTTNFGLTIPGVQVGQDTVTLKLDYSPADSVDGKHVWKYVTHF